jgi:plastocyanin
MRIATELALLSPLFFSAITLIACSSGPVQPSGGAGGTTTSTGATGGGGTGGHDHGGGGAGGATTSTGVTGGGGTGGMPECAVDGDCGISDDCHIFECDAGDCKESFAAPGTKTGAQAFGDCKANVCDGAGAIVSENDDLDVFADQNDCTIDTCVDGTPANDATPIGAVCASNGGKLCDGAKSCVECLMGGDCVSGVCSAGNTCAPAECGDGAKNGTETDIDCGGPVCGKCPADKACDVATDCIDGVCDPAQKLCKAATCMDVVKNGMETDVDCGGPACPDCGNGKLCTTGADCVSLVCSGNPSVCQVPTCMDNTKNGTETGLDCGGAACPDCPDGQPCVGDGDCLSGYCNPGNVCATPTCMDNAKNGTETDVDCGGSCPDCADGETCAVGSDCASTFCFGNPLTCQSMLNGCTLATATDLTGQSMVNISFGGFFYTPKCIKVSPGTMVTWSGTFMSHPLQGGAVVNNVPFPDNSSIQLTNTGTSKTITFGAAGAFPYYCQFHVNSMQGVVFVQ